MDPVLPPGPEWLRRRQLIEERKVADLERRLRAPSVRSLADLDDTAIDYLSEPPEDGDTLVFDESLGNDLSPAGRWRPGEGGGGGGGGDSSSLIWQMYEDMTPWVVHRGASHPDLLLDVINSGGSRGISVPTSGVYAFTASLFAEDAGDVSVQMTGPRVQGPVETCIYQLVADHGGQAASVAADFACPNMSNVTVTVDAPGITYWSLHVSAHLVMVADILDGDCGA